MNKENLNLVRIELLSKYPRCRDAIEAFSERIVRDAKIISSDEEIFRLFRQRIEELPCAAQKGSRKRRRPAAKQGRIDKGRFRPRR